MHQRSSSRVTQDGRLTNRDGSRLELYRTAFVGEFGLGAKEIGGRANAAPLTQLSMLWKLQDMDLASFLTQQAQQGLIR